MGQDSMDENRQNIKPYLREIRIMRHFLNQYRRASEQQEHLRGRLKRIRSELGGSADGESTALSFRESELEARVKEQQKAVEAQLLRIMDIIDYLEPASPERMILELHYIDKLPWSRIQEEAHMSRSSCYAKRDRGIRTLLTFKRVREAVEAYAQAEGL